MGFMVGNAKLIGALEKIKSWLDYGTFTPIQVASTVALNGDQACVKEITEVYRKRRDVMVSSFENAGWPLTTLGRACLCGLIYPNRYRKWEVWSSATVFDGRKGGSHARNRVRCVR